ncbi:MAG: hypothetical protein MZW92_76795 [Comamonadaceae bacterium]|nr:hypothetical protein [Comamonadaceae bacterium]
MLSSAVGHLLELAVPDEFEVKRGKWSFAHLPVIPPHFDAGARSRRTRTALKLLRQADQAQGRDRPDQRLRRRARGRADLPLHRAARQGQASRSSGCGCSP